MSLIDLFTRHEASPIRQGDIYRRSHPQGVMETATVLSLARDMLGIPHVRFQVRFERRTSTHIDTATRVLAMSAFEAAYRNRS
jgi:hypothetical protein